MTRNRWAWSVSLAFVILTLAALILVPLFVQRRVDMLRVEIQTSEPARTLLMGLQYNLVREMAALAEFERTGATEDVDTFTAAFADERAIYRELEPLARALGRDVYARFVEVRTLASQWHARTGGEKITGTNREESLFQQLLFSTARLDLAILRHTQSARDEIEAAERSGLRLIMLLGLMAILAAGTVTALFLRAQRLAEEAELRRLETAAALEQSARAAEARTRLLRGITHDVKNPLGAAKGYAELLELGVKGEIAPEQMKLIKGLERSVDSALAIISDLLDVARADSGGMSVHRVPIDLRNLLQEAVADHHPAADARGHELTLEGEAGDPAIVHTDPARVRQVLDNLITNAIKYTPPPGRIVVSLDPDARDGPNMQRAVALRVQDTGPGIPPDKREAVFDEFTRLDDGGSMKGHGLGLAIARRVARLLGGELGLVDTRGPGAMFVLWLPERESQV